MKQYCRYCVNLCVNEVPYCDAHKEFRSESSCKHPNNCKDFIFANVEPEYQDAFGETNGYKEHKPIQKVCEGQFSLFDFSGDPDYQGKRDEIVRASIEDKFTRSINLIECSCGMLPREKFIGCHEFFIECQCGRKTKIYRHLYKAKQSWNKEQVRRKNEKCI